jgi:energy-coupling factor transporter transmembrane protein EcfT
MALSLIVMTAIFYVSTVVLPAVGFASLVTGIVIGAVRRVRRLRFSALPFVLTQIFLVIVGATAGAFRTKGPEPSSVSGTLALEQIHFNRGRSQRRRSSSGIRPV